MAKKISDEVLKTTIIINGDKAQTELIKIEERQRKLKQANKELRAEKAKLILQNKKGGEEWKRLNAQISENNAKMKVNEAEMAKLRNKIGLTGLTLQQLKRRAAELRLSLSNMIPDTAEYKKYQAELDQVNARLRKIRSNGSRTNSALGRLANGVNKYFNLVTATVAAIAGMAFSLQSMVDHSATLEDAQADVMKTTGQTIEEVRNLTREMDQFNTRTPRIELLKLAEEAGRLGKKSRQDVMEFVETANMLKVALGDDLGGEEAIREVGKLTEQYRIGEPYGRKFGESMEMLGSSINHVSASGSNQAAYLVDYLKRLSGISDQANIAAQDQLGFAAALDESGQRVETAATAMSNVIVDMYKDTATYAGIAGRSQQDFSKLLKEDANEALLLFLEGLNGNNEGLDVMSKKLSELGIDGSRATSVLATLAANTDKVRVRQEQANQALEAGTSLVDEYNIKNNNLAANVAKVSRALRAKFISPGLIKFLERSFSALAKLTDKTETYEQKQRKLQAALNAELNILQAGEFTQKERARLISEINDEYGEYLPRLLKEKDSLEDILDIQKKMNKEFEARILYAAFEEEIAKAIEKQKNAAEGLYQNEKRRAALRTGGEQDLTPGQLTRQQEQLDMFDILNQQVIDKGSEAQEEIENKYEDIFESLGLKFQEWRKKMAGITSGEEQSRSKEAGSNSPENSERVKAEQKIQDFLASLDQSEEDRVREKFQEMLDLADKYHISRKQLEEAMHNELRELRWQLDQDAADQELQRKIQLMESSLQQLWEYEQGHLYEQYRNEELTKKEFDDKLYQAELDHLSRMLEARKQLGLETLDLEKQITEAKEKEAERRIKAEEDYRDALSQSTAASAFNAAAQAKNEEEAARAVANEVRQMIQARIAEAIAGVLAKEFASKGLLGAITGAVGAGAVGILFNKLIPAFDDGLYDVLDHNGNKYRARRDEALSTGYYSSPTVSYSKNMLVAEKRPEIVVDGLATKKLIQFRPDVIEGINWAAGRTAVKGYAQGNYPETTSISKADLAETNALLRAILAEQGRPNIALADDRFARDMQEKLLRDQYIKSKSDL